MEREQFEAVKAMGRLPNPMFGSDLIDRTLMYGYDVDRNTWHLYQIDGIMYLYVYDYLELEVTFQILGDEVDPRLVIPNKRTYPASVDFRFATFCRSHGIDPNFTTWDVDRYEKVKHLTFHGKIHPSHGGHEAIETRA